jgi:RNA-binding protein YhbY
MDLGALKKESKGLNSVVQIGKNGATFPVLDQIKRILQKKKLIKIKLSRSFVEEQEKEGKKKKDIGQDLADSTNSVVVDVVGFTVSLAKRR